MKIFASTNSNLLSIFWYINGEFYGLDSTLKGENVDQYGDYLQINEDHFSIWPKYRKAAGLPSDTEYDAYPRGRIMFNVKLHKFTVIGTDSLTMNNQMRDKILDYYGLPNTTIFETDEHYNSSSINEEDW